ncbi:MAG: hypothetical protein ACI4XJ_04455 [Eubacteriales bacterium]
MSTKMQINRKLKSHTHFCKCHTCGTVSLPLSNGFAEGTNNKKK